MTLSPTVMVEIVIHPLPWTRTTESSQKHPDDDVAVKAFVVEPVCGWGSVTREMHGIVKEVKHDGAVKVQFGFNPENPTEGLWTTQLKELEVVDPEDFRGSYTGHWPGKLQLGSDSDGKSVTTSGSNKRLTKTISAVLYMTKYREVLNCIDDFYSWSGT